MGCLAPSESAEKNFEVFLAPPPQHCSTSNEMQILNGSEVDPPPFGRSQSLPRGRMGAPLQLIGDKVAGNIVRDTPLLLTLPSQAYMFGGYVKEGQRYVTRPSHYEYL